MNDEKKKLNIDNSEENLSFSEFIQKARGLCHDLNQPMQAISGYSDLLAMTISKEDPQYVKIVKIQEAITQANEIILDLMSLVRTQAKNTPK